MNYLGIEHLQPGQNVFHWQLPKDTGPDTVDPKSLDLTCVNLIEREKFKSLITFYRKKKHMTPEQATAVVLRKNQFSEIAKANPDAGIRAGQIRKGGVM